MAKVKSPLFGFDASGQLAKTLVYMKWKGINDVRQHVIPANPNTAAQQTQRGYIADAVALWHATGWTPEDLTSWNRYAGVKPKPMSGYNAYTSDYLATVLAAKVFNPLYELSCVSSTPGELTVLVKGDPSLTVVNVRFGVSKTAMFNVLTLSEAPAGTYSRTLTGLVEGAKYYTQVYIVHASNAGNTGIDMAEILVT